MSTNLRITGHLKHVAKPKTYGTEGKLIHKFYLDLDKDKEHPTVGEFTCFGDKIAFNEFSEGDKVDVRFSISGRTWQNPETKKNVFFQSLVAFDMEKSTEEPLKTPVQSDYNENDPDDDLPF